MRSYYLYILASRKNGALYIGITNNLIRRVQEHKQGLIKGFTQKYNTHQLVYFEEGKYIQDVIAAEKRLKVWQRQWKIDLIEKTNPEWKDLYYELIRQS